MTAQQAVRPTALILLLGAVGDMGLFNENSTQARIGN
jgi:hypothetical protein